MSVGLLYDDTSKERIYQELEAHIWPDLKYTFKPRGNALSKKIMQAGHVGIAQATIIYIPKVNILE